MTESRHNNTKQHTTTGFARRALLLLTFIVAFVGNVWGQTVKIKESATAKITETVYAKNGQSSYGLSTEIVSKIITNVPGLAADNIYVRWSAYKNNERVLFDDKTWNNKLYINPSNGMAYQFPVDQNGYCIYGQVNVYLSSTIEEVLGAKITIEKDNLTLDDYVIEYYISKNREQIRSNTEEPDEFDMKVELIFNEKGKKEDNFLNDNNSTATYDRLPQTITLGDEYNAATNTVTLSQPEDWPESDVRFVRWYIARADGNLLDAEEESSTWINQPTGFMKDDEGSHGWYWHDASALNTKSLQIPTVTLPEGEDFEDYRLVAVMSTEEGTLDGNTLTKEPIYTLMYYFNFEFPFRGDASGTTKAETTLKVRPSRQSNSMTLSFDYNTGMVKLMSGSEELDSAPINDIFKETYPTLPENFYIRWFLRKGDTETYIENSLDGGNLYFTPAKDKYYYYWSTEKDKEPRNLSDILKITIDGSKLSSLTDYDLVCTIATILDGEDYDNSGYLTHEPNTLAFEYTFHFADKFIEAENLSSLSPTYQKALYERSTGKMTPILFVDGNSYKEVMSDIGASSFYMRCYITDTEGDLVSDMGQWEFNSTMKVGEWDTGYLKNGAYGYYIMVSGLQSYEAYKYNPTFTMPESYNKNEDYKKFQIVCIIATNTEGMDLPDKEPTNIVKKYVFNEFIIDDEITHYKGQSGRDWITPNISTRPKDQTQLYWDNGEIMEILPDIRQGVHTWEYDVYVLPNESRSLILPFQGYDNNGQELEPRAYIRWYDWRTDKKVSGNNFTFTAYTDQFNQLREKNHGLYALCLSDANFTQKSIGVTFTPTDDFSNSIDIACDVSKYFEQDGFETIYGTHYLLHEPTLSNRYIFHIRPASEIATRLATANLEMITAETNAIDKEKKQKLYDAMSALEEEKGKVVVALNGTSGNFALRFDHHTLLNYALQNGTTYVSADKTQWYAYFEDDNGKIWKKEITGSNDATGRITTFTYSAFEGQYYDLAGTPKTDVVNNEKKFHVVGYVVSNTGIKAPVVHYELHFINAPITNLTDIPNERTEAYMRYYYDLATVVDFDGNPKTNPNVVGHEAEYYSTSTWDAIPTNRDDNMTHVPFPWDNIQYGFCYPELRYVVKNGWCTGRSPLHGEYTVLKSMNEDGISDSPDIQVEVSPDEYRWWDHTPLFDYTYNMTKNSDSPQYGSFLYTDASDESRSIATIPFTAELCHGSSIYFTAVVADMTTSNIKPQLLIRIVGIDAKGNRRRIMAFHTGEIAQGAGSWKQIYCASTVPTNFDPNITQFEAEVINYANGTQGADFAIDQLMIYTSTTKVLLTQTGSNSCDDEEANEENKVQVYMVGEGLLNKFGEEDKLQPIYWRICEEGSKAPIKGVGMYPRYDQYGNKTEDLGENTYGIAWVNPSDLKKTKDSDLPNEYGWYKVGEQYFFQLANKSFSALEEGKNYYVSVYEPEDIPFVESNPASWGSVDDPCSIYSEFFIPRRQYVTYIIDAESGTEGGDYVIGCGSSSVELPPVKMVMKVPNKNNKITGFETFDDWRFDYAFFPASLWNTGTKLGDDTEYTYEDLYTAWRHYRGANSDYAKDEYTDSGLDDGYQGKVGELDCHAVLRYAIEKGLLVLANSNNYKPTFNKAGTYTILCLPIKQEITLDKETTPTQICAPFEVTFTVKGGGNLSLVLGFDGVSYPSNYTRVVRVGLEQLNNAKADSKKGFTVHIPVQSFESASGSLVFDSPNLTLYRATDGKAASTTTNVAILQDDARVGRATVNSTHKYLAVKFDKDFVFYEGFEYELHTVYYDKDDDNGSGQHKEDACFGDLYFIIKVVPEFVTWNDGTITEKSNVNDNWNCDDNWSRSTRAELYKSEDGIQNTKTEAQGDGTEKGIYKNNAQINNELTSNPAFVPMKFTYVTVPEASSPNKAPNLINLAMGTNGIYTNIGNDATGNIEYDMMVRYTEKTCIDHGITDIPVYDCEKFYGNWAKEIYFKPRAELVNQHYLTYEKVWVEKQLEANTWTLMSTPLQNTYAGDMYVPAVAIPDYSKDGDEVTGQQVTEAFQPITFNTTNYSRTLYPIYQRSWGMEQGKVYTKKEDVRGEYYSALLKFPTKTVETTFAEWSHTYNDVQVPYSTWKGFAIRAHKKAQKDKTLIRLPKEDVRYDYYQWDGVTTPDLATNNDVKAVSKPKDNDGIITGKLFTDGENPVKRLTYGVDYGGTTPSTPRTAGNGDVNVKLDDVQNVDGYLLVGNPYLCSIDMTEFLKVNYKEDDGILATNGYWTYENNTVGAYMDGINNYIKPLQSFFVKLKDNATTNIIFTSAMMVGNDGVQKVMPKPMMTMTAANDRGKSTATISVDDEARSIETLFDSNLNDVPMVYTVAEGQAVSINQLTELDKPIAFGVTCAASDDPVTVTFSDIAQLTTDDVFVVDAVTGDRTLVNEGNSISVQPNDYGRYFLLAGATNIGNKADVQKGIVVSIRNRAVTVTSGEALTLVRATLLDGTTAYQYTGGDTTASFTLTSGVYIIHAENAAGEQQTVKVIVKGN